MNSPTSTRIALLLGLCAIAVGLCLPATRATAGLFSTEGDGTIVKRNRELGHFTGVALSLAAQVELRIGNAETATVETDQNLQSLVETVVENGTLQIRAKGPGNIDPHVLRIVVQARQIDHLAVGGSGSINADALRAPRLKLEVSGSGAIGVKSAEAETISAFMGGSGNMKLGGGSTRKLSVSIGGSGDVQAGDLRADQVNVNIGGSGDVTVWAREALKAAIAGSGDINYYGDPKVKGAVVGSGGMKRLGPAPR